MIFFLFGCAELIEELARATDLKFGMRVENVVYLFICGVYQEVNSFNKT